jgi:hypothetical protein
MQRAPCLDHFTAWQRGAELDPRYFDGLTTCQDWANLELDDESFASMSEHEQRSIDSWAFGVSPRVSQVDGTSSESLPKYSGVLCAELVTAVGKDQRFYWPTVVSLE